METGNDLIDSEHRTLFDAINDLMDACSSGQGRSKIGETADFLADYVDKHFADEEDLQRKNHYPHYQQHHNFHVIISRRSEIWPMKSVLMGRM